jgi:hypothetical protein
MAAKNASKRQNNGVQSVKMLLSAASVAATLGGWVAFSLPEPTTQASTLQSHEVSIDLAPIPTVLPRPSGLQSPDQAGNPTDLPTVKQADPTQPVLPTLRTVNAQPPKAVTKTKSSR